MSMHIVKIKACIEYQHYQLAAFRQSHIDTNTSTLPSYPFEKSWKTIIFAAFLCQNRATWPE